MAFAKKAVAPAPSIKERIAAIRKEAQELIETRVPALKAESENTIPEPVLRQMITARDKCLCDTLLRLTEGD